MDEKYKIMLFNNGLMTALYKAGFVGTKPFLYRDIYLFVDAQIKVRSITKTVAILEAMDRFNVSEKTIKRALKSFE